MEIFDARGRLVRTLFEGRREAGVWTEMWDGRDRRGSPAASGVYFARLKTAGGAATIRKLVLVK
jgi:flagellar hook assembly protein FlgD